MRVKRTICISVTIAALLLLLLGCGPIPLDRLGLTNLSVSAQKKSEKSMRSESRVIETRAVTDERYYKAERQAGSRGDRVVSLTPEIFVLDIDDIVVYNRIGANAYISKKILPRVNGPAGIVPQHYDLVHTRGMIREAMVQKGHYDGLSMQFLPGDEFISSRSYDSFTNDGSFVYSIVGVPLPVEYDGIALPHEIAAADIPGLEEGLHYFSFKHLQPIETNSGFVSYLTIGTDVREQWVQNPSGVIGDWVNPVTMTDGNAIGIYLTSDTPIDVLSFKDPEVVLFWDLDGLIEVWDRDTPDPSDDIVTFKLHDPFPVSLLVQERQLPLVSTTDLTPPNEVFLPAIAGKNSANTLQWVNPRDDDFKEVVITRKAGSPPTDRSDGVEVYRYHIPNYVDLSGTSGTHYHYLVQTVDYSGNYSQGVRLEQTQL